MLSQKGLQTIFSPQDDRIPTNVEIAEVFARVGQQQHGAAGDPLPDHLEHKLETQPTKNHNKYQSMDVWTLPDEVEVAGVWPLMK